MAVGLKINIKKRAFTERVKKRVEFNLGTVGAFLVKRLQAQVEIPYPPASRVGESPHRRKGMAGGLQGSFKFIVRRTLTGVTLTVFTDQVYALRLEFGFVGVDRAGRNINQGPRPYWRVVMGANKRTIGVGVARDP